MLARASLTNDREHDKRIKILRTTPTGIRINVHVAACACARNFWGGLYDRAAKQAQVERLGPRWQPASSEIWHGDNRSSFRHRGSSF
jgi:hypothetical protein